MYSLFGSRAYSYLTVSAAAFHVAVMSKKFKKKYLSENTYQSKFKFGDTLKYRAFHLHTVINSIIADFENNMLLDGRRRCRRS